jgi:integrase
MKRHRTSQSVTKQASAVYEQVFNTGGARVRGLWSKNNRYYAQLDANDGNQYRYQLQARTVPQAVLARQALKSKQQAGNLFPPGNDDQKEGPKEGPRSGQTLETVVKLYQEDRDGLKKKDPSTAKREDSGLRFWVGKFGGFDFTEVNGNTLREFAKWRIQTHQVSGRAVDLDVRALTHVYNFARESGILPSDYADLKWSPLAEPPTKDELLSREQIDAMCQAALLNPEALAFLKPQARHLRAAQAVTGQGFHDYLRLLQHSGGREHETCMQQWPNVTRSRTAKYHGDGGSQFKKGDKIAGNLYFPGKYAKAGGGKPAEDRWVDFHPGLEEHLLEMYERRDPESKWMFPGRDTDAPIGRFYKQLNRVKRDLRRTWEATAKKSGIKDSQWFDRVTFQWSRHYFISHGVMAGIDYKTIAYWVSHRDGGVLIGRLYGHLDKRHGQAMAQKMAVHLTARS